MSSGPAPVAVVGPTASGKSELALDLAEHYRGEIINIDAMQQYRGMDIGTAKLPLDERRGIAHHQLDVLDVTETATVARYQQAASADVERMLDAGTVPIIVGGSMMYVQALLDNWQFPATDPQVRARYEAQLAEHGVDHMHRELAKVDPVAADSILATDGRRIVRALEVVELTGQPFAASAPEFGQLRWDTRIIAIDRDTSEIDERIELRTEKMFTDGLVDEVEALVQQGLRSGTTAPRAIGYSQVLDLLDGVMTGDEAQERTMIGTRRYVRRQRSWFRRDGRIAWFSAAEPHLVDAVLTRLGDE